MKKNNKTAKIPESFDSLKAASDFWDCHSVADHWDMTKEVEFDVEIKNESRHVTIEMGLIEKD